MRIIFLLLLFLIPVQLFAQSWLTRENTYFFVSTGVDLRNATFGGTVNPVAYDGTWTTGYRNGHFSVLMYYETFSLIEYESIGINPGYIFRERNLSLLPIYLFQL